jgi:hypothetical protein
LKYVYDENWTYDQLINDDEINQYKIYWIEQNLNSLHEFNFWFSISCQAFLNEATIPNISWSSSLTNWIRLRESWIETEFQKAKQNSIQMNQIWIFSNPILLEWIWLICWFCNNNISCGIVVSIAPCHGADPDSISGGRD